MLRVPYPQVIFEVACRVSKEGQMNPNDVLHSCTHGDVISRNGNNSA